MIRSAQATDAESIAEIYNHYIVNSHATFELDPITSDEMASRIERVQLEYKLPWIVLETDGEIAGYAYATQWKPRKAYSKTTETSIYLRNGQGGNGYGKQLYAELLDQLRSLEYHVAIGGMSLPNESSRILHEKLGFKKIGEFKEVGYKFNRWIDVGYWELILNR